MSKWIRDLTCIVAGVVVKDLRIEFQVQKGIDSAPNTANVKIYNLKESNRNKIKEEFDSLVLRGGYANGVTGLLFTGAIRTVDNYRENGVNIVTEITAGEADDSHRNASVNKTIEAADSSPPDIIKYLHSQMSGVELGEMVGVSTLPPKRRPVVLNDTVYNEMNKVTKANDLFWSVQNNKLEVIPYDDAIQDVTVVSQRTGMIHSPEITELGLNVKTLLDFNLVPNRLIDVYSELKQGKGLFRVNEVTYSGNNIDGDYVASIKAAKVGTDGVKNSKYKKDIV